MEVSHSLLTSPYPRKGYELEILRSGTIDSKFLCTICKLILRNPVQRSCGHRYCKDCAEETCGTSTDLMTCSGCGDDEAIDVLEEFQLLPDYAVKREMAKIEVCCSHLACKWTGIFKDFVEHFEEHIAVASDKVCPIGCRARLDEGCNTEDHIRGALPQHLEIVNSRLLALESQLQPRGGSPIDARIRTVERQLANMMLKLESAVCTPLQSGMQAALNPILEKLSIFESIVTVLNREIEKLTSDVQSMERQSRLERELLDSVVRKARGLERIIAMKDMTISELTVKMADLEQSSYDGTLLLCVTDVARKRHEAVEGSEAIVNSPPFYTCRTGYKMRAYVYLNGDDSGKDTHLSVFFAVMQGHYDAVLRWPFNRTVTFILVNQIGYDNVVYVCHPDPSNISFKRPTTSKNIRCGYPKFAPLEVLDEKAGRGFVRNDQLLLKVIVDSSDI